MVDCVFNENGLADYKFIPTLINSDFQATVPGRIEQQKILKRFKKQSRRISAAYYHFFYSNIYLTSIKLKLKIIKIFRSFKTIIKLIDKIISKIIVYLIFLKFDGDFWKIKLMLNKLNGSKKRKKYVMAYNEIMRRNGSWIGDRAQFDGKPEFPHGMKGVFISHGAKIGINCVIFQHVTIGSNRLLDSKGRGTPTIGNDCYIGAGAKVIGNVRIGRNCRIGANCVVFKDMPDNSVAVLQPPRIIKKREIDNQAQIPLEQI